MMLLLMVVMVNVDWSRNDNGVGFLLHRANVVRFVLGGGVTHQTVVVGLESIQIKVDKVHFFVRLGLGGRE